MSQHVSLDLETLGKKPDALIVAIGAVKFDPHTGAMGDTFYQVIDIGNSPGGTADASTIVWWMNQSQAARDALFSKDVEKISLPHALVEFSEWLGFDDTLPDDDYPDNEIWQRGDRDCLWLESAYAGVGFKVPFGFWQIGDERRFTRYFKAVLPARDQALIGHTALGDAIYQAQCVAAVFARMNSVGAFVVPPNSTPVQPPLNLDWDPVLGDVVDVELVDPVEEVRQKALETAYICGLNTVGEAISNIEMHSTSMWPYAEIESRLAELQEAFDGFTGDEKVLDHLLPYNREKIDAELAALELADTGK